MKDVNFRIFHLQGTAIQFAISVNSLFILTIKFDKDLSQVLLGTQINVTFKISLQPCLYNVLTSFTVTVEDTKLKPMTIKKLEIENLLQICWNVNLYKNQFKYSQMVQGKSSYPPSHKKIKKKPSQMPFQKKYWLFNKSLLE